MTNTQRAAVAAGLVGAGAFLLSALRRSRRMDFAGRSVLIVGGSRGLGLVMARQLADEGASVTLAARDEDELERARQDILERTPDADVAVVVCDVRQPEDAEQAVHAVIHRTGYLDVLINNAGVIMVAPVDHLEPSDFEEAMGVHFWGPLHTMLAAVPFMRRQGEGRILNVSSIGGKIGVPHLVPYCASKFALAGLSDSLRAELAKDGIRVTSAFPGLMRTGSAFNAQFKGNHRQEFAWFAISDSLPVITVPAERAAARMLDACRHGDAEALIGWTTKLAVKVQALAPSLVAHMLETVDRLVLPAARADASRADASVSAMEIRTGWQSTSPWAPSPLTRLTERAAKKNNETLH